MIRRDKGDRTHFRYNSCKSPGDTRVVSRQHPPNSKPRTLQYRFRVNLRRLLLKMGKICEFSTSTLNFYHLGRHSGASEQPNKCAIDRVVGLPQVDETQEQQYEHFPSQLLQLAYCEHQVCRRAVRAEASLLPRHQSLRLVVGAESRSNYLEEDLTHGCYE